MIHYFAEAYRRPDNTAWLGLLNPLTTPQDVRVELLGHTVARTVSVPPRARVAVELGDWGAGGEFGLEVRCGSVCAASLVMWDKSYSRPNTSVPVVGCEVAP